MTRLFSSLSHYLREGETDDDQQRNKHQEQRQEQQQQHQEQRQEQQQQHQEQHKEQRSEGRRHSHSLPKGISEAEAANLLGQSDRLLDVAWQLLHDPDWKPAYDKHPVRVLSQKSRHRSAGKAWRLETIVNLPAERMFLEMWDQVDQQTDWNANLVLSEVVARFSPDVTILHNATADQAGGLVKARDFVTLCVRGSRSGVQFTGGASIETGLVPPLKRFVRGENFPGCIACLPVTAYSCKLVWIMDSDIKGWIPTSIIDQAMTNAVSQLGLSIQQLASKIVVKEKRTISIEDD